MCFQTALQSGPSLAAAFPRRVWTPLVIGSLVLMTGLAYGRSPISAPLPDLEFQRNVMAGSDALLERMVIPPNRPDWLLTDCGTLDASARETTSTSYDRMRHALCEAARKSNVAVRN